MQKGAYYRRYNPLVANVVRAVLTLNADQRFPETELVVHQRGKDIIVLPNPDARLEPFTYPLFNFGLRY